MKFSVNGEVKELVARAYVPNTSFDELPDCTDTLLEDQLKGLKKELFGRSYKATAEQFAEMEALVILHNENTRLHQSLTKEEEDAYDDWDMTRCVNTADVMTQKEHDFLTSLKKK